jgi:hypothetical protein
MMIKTMTKRRAEAGMEAGLTILTMGQDDGLRARRLARRDRAGLSRPAERSVGTE